jgi:hypothetical protein
LIVFTGFLIVLLLDNGVLLVIVVGVIFLVAVRPEGNSVGSQIQLM